MADASGGPAEDPRGEVVPAGRESSVQDWAELLVARARDEGIALTGEGGLLTDLRIRPLGRSRRMRQLTRAYGTVAVAGWRLALGAYLAVTLFLVVPVVISLTALAVSFNVL